MITIHLKNSHKADVKSVKGFVEDAHCLNLVYTNDSPYTNYISYDLDNKTGHNITIGDITYTPKQIIENPEYILTLMNQELTKDAIEALS